MLIEPRDKILNIIDKRGYIHLDEFINLSLNKLERSYYKSSNPLGKTLKLISSQSAEVECSSFSAKTSCR